MALPRKGLRKIVVDGITYAWSIRKKATRIQSEYRDGCLNVAIERSDDPSIKLLVRTNAIHPKNVFNSKPVGVLPSDVRRWIKQGIQAGWGDSGPSVHVLDVRSKTG